MTKIAADASEYRYIRKREVLNLTSMSASTLQRRINDKSFPSPFEISLGRVAWREAEVVEWLASRSKARA